MKTSELTGAALDWAVAKCEGLEAGKFYGLGGWSTDWAKGGPIIEKAVICLESNCGIYWWAKFADTSESEVDGNTPLEAAMRCYVTSRLGAEVEIPKELSNA